MKVLITGAAGFVGFHLAKSLLECGGVSVFGVDNCNSYYDPKLKNERLRVLKGYDYFEFSSVDLADRDAVDKLFARNQFGCVIHLAAQAGVRYSILNPRAYSDSNLSGFVNVLEGVRNQKKSPHFIFASSSSVYGNRTKEPFSTSDRVDHPVSLYAATKKANELMAHTYSHLYGIPTTGLRFFTVYGPWGRPDMAYFSFTKAILEGKPIDVFNDGKLKRDFTYIDDIVSAIVKLIDKPPVGQANWDSDFGDPSASSAPYKIYNIGNNQPVELETFISTIEEAVGKRAIKNYLPMQPGDVLATYADIEDLKRDIGFSPSTPLKDGIAKFVEWYRDYYKC